MQSFQVVVVIGNCTAFEGRIVCQGKGLRADLQDESGHCSHFPLHPSRCTGHPAKEQHTQEQCRAGLVDVSAINLRSGARKSIRPGPGSAEFQTVRVVLKRVPIEESACSQVRLSSGGTSRIPYSAVLPGGGEQKSWGT